jgi:hypothetical protein
LSIAFGALVVLMFFICLLALGFATRSAVVVGPAAILLGIWLALTGYLAAHGKLSATPPLFLIMLAVVLIQTIAFACGPFGLALASLPLWALIGMQAFRIAVEIILHVLQGEGRVPVQMTFSGYNFDIASGITAFLLAPFASRVPRWVVRAWNSLALGLLLVILCIAIVSTPRFHVFAEPNLFAAQFPYVWLPMFLVPLALLGHILVFRRLRSWR